MHSGTGERINVLCTLTYQNLLFSRDPINSILGFIIRTYKKVGLGRLGYTYIQSYIHKERHQIYMTLHYVTVPCSIYCITLIPTNKGTCIQTDRRQPCMHADGKQTFIFAR